MALAPVRKGTEGRFVQEVGLYGWSVEWTAPMHLALITLFAHAHFPCFALTIGLAGCAKDRIYGETHL